MKKIAEKKYEVVSNSILENENKKSDEIYADHENNLPNHSNVEKNRIIESIECSLAIQGQQADAELFQARREIATKDSQHFRCPVGVCRQLFLKKKLLRKHLRYKRREDDLHNIAFAEYENKLPNLNNLEGNRINSIERNLAIQEHQGNAESIQPQHKIVTKASRFRCSVENCRRFYSTEKSLRKHLKFIHRKEYDKIATCILDKKIDNQSSNQSYPGNQNISVPDMKPRKNRYIESNVAYVEGKIRKIYQQPYRFGKATDEYHSLGIHDRVISHNKQLRNSPFTQPPKRIERGSTKFPSNSIEKPGKFPFTKTYNDFHGLVKSQILKKNNQSCKINQLKTEEEIGRRKKLQNDAEDNIKTYGKKLQYKKASMALNKKLQAKEVPGKTMLVSTDLENDLENQPEHNLSECILLPEIRNQILRARDDFTTIWCPGETVKGLCAPAVPDLQLREEDFKQIGSGNVNGISVENIAIQEECKEKNLIHLNPCNGYLKNYGKLTDNTIKPIELRKGQVSGKHTNDITFPVQKRKRRSSEPTYAHNSIESNEWTTNKGDKNIGNSKLIYDDTAAVRKDSQIVKRLMDNESATSSKLRPLMTTLVREYHAEQSRKFSSKRFVRENDQSAAEPTQNTENTNEDWSINIDKCQSQYLEAMSIGNIDNIDLDSLPNALIPTVQKMVNGSGHYLDYKLGEDPPIKNRPSDIVPEKSKNDETDMNSQQKTSNTQENQQAMAFGLVMKYVKKHLSGSSADNAIDDQYISMCNDTSLENVFEIYIEEYQKESSAATNDAGETDGEKSIMGNTNSISLHPNIPVGYKLGDLPIVDHDNNANLKKLDVNQPDGNKICGCEISSQKKNVLDRHNDQLGNDQKEPIQENEISSCMDDSSLLQDLNIDDSSFCNNTNTKNNHKTSKRKREKKRRLADESAENKLRESSTCSYVAGRLDAEQSTGSIPSNEKEKYIANHFWTEGLVFWNDKEEEEHKLVEELRALDERRRSIVDRLVKIRKFL